MEDVREGWSLDVELVGDVRGKRCCWLVLEVRALLLAAY